MHSLTAAATYSFGRYEVAVQRATARVTGRGSVVFDIGANIGFHTLVAAALVGPNGRVYALEPEPACAAIIAANCRANGLAQVEVLNVAAWSEAGQTHLIVPASSGAEHAILADVAGVPREIYGDAGATTELVSVDDLVAREAVPAPSVVKMDVQGAEVEVLKGMSTTLDEARPTLICELHDTHDAVADELSSHGYAMRHLDGRALQSGERPGWILAEPAA